MYIVTAYKIYEKFDDLDKAMLYFNCLVLGGYKYIEVKEKITTEKYEYFQSIKIFVR